MFFKKNDKFEKDSVNIAYFVTFVFWGSVLFINAVSEWIYDRDLIPKSFTILIMGLVVFFLTEWIATRIKKSQANK